MDNSKLIRGGEFLIKDVDAKDIFIPEEFDEEQQMIAQTCKDFLDTEIFPNLDRIDSQEEGLMREMIAKAGELGLLGISVPEEYEGFGQSFVTSMLASEAMGAGSSFSVAYSAHTGIGSLPIVYYGTHEQKQKYLPSLATGEKAAAYCLTEPGAGSDANSGKTQAILSEDGTHYVMNGQKMWITNGGFADVLTVFAKIGNDRVYSAFIVEAGWEGVSMNPEEKKMGIKGSSTVQIFFNDVKVPVENLIAKPGQGFRIALNILHMGRIKLGAATLGAAKLTITQSVNYANERKQFGKLISDFPAIQYKLGEQIIRTWVNEAAVYRIAQDIDDMKVEMIAGGMDEIKASIESIAHYAVEDAAMKVFSSETLDYVVDEGVQIFGGMGYSAEMPVDRAYRDSRINRIFEGTNEINRLLISETLIKKGPKIGLNFQEEYDKIFAEVGDDFQTILEGTEIEQLNFYAKKFKKLSLLVLGAFLQVHKSGFTKEQEIMSSLSDILIQTYAAESAVLRAEKLQANGAHKDLVINIAKSFVFDASFRIRKYTYDAIGCFLEGEELCAITEKVDKLSRVAVVNTRDLHRSIAEKCIEENKYFL